MIGRILTKLFFRNEPAKGLVFAITLAMVGTGLWISLVFWLWQVGVIPSLLLPGWDNQVNMPLLTSLIVILVILIYCVTVFFCSILRLGVLVYQKRNFRALWWGVPILFCIFVGNASMGIISMAVNNAMRIFGFGWPEPARLADTIIRACSPLLPHTLIWGTCLLLLAGYLLTAKFAAACGQLKMRQCFGVATLTLWGLYLLFHVAALAGAWSSSAQAERVRLAVERRFGRPLTAAALEARYRESGKIDGAFWKSCQAHRKALESFISANQFPDNWDFTLPDRPSAHDFDLFERFCREHSAALSQWENGFAHVPPLPEREFIPGRLYEMLLPELLCQRSFCRLERARFQAALYRRDLPETLAAYNRLKNGILSFRKEPCLIGSLLWISMENLRVNCVENFLESRILSEAQLAALDGELAEVEQYIPINQQQAMYSEAVFGQDVIYGLETGKGTNPSLALASFRWVAPLLWRLVAQDKANMLQIYLAEDFVKMNSTDVTRKAGKFCRMLLSALDIVGNKFYSLTARVRAARVLIRAEQHRRKHGEFPKALSRLPLDPFSGNPLQYRVGETTISEMYWHERTVKQRLRNVHAVQVWSVGANRYDENGVNGNASDDVRAMIL